MARKGRKRLDIDRKLPSYVKNDYVRAPRLRALISMAFKRSPYLEGGNIILGNKLLLQHHLCGHDDLGRENMHVICIGKLEQAAGWGGKAVIRREITSLPTTPKAASESFPECVKNFTSNKAASRYLSWQVYLGGAVSLQKLLKQISMVRCVYKKKLLYTYPAVHH
jgi:hypothetical protein